MPFSMSSCFNRDVSAENFPSLASVRRHAAKMPLVAPAPAVAVSDPRNDPIAIYIRKVLAQGQSCSAHSCQGGSKRLASFGFPVFD